MNDGLKINGVGMTSLRTRRRLVARLTEKGIANKSVLNAIENTPRHLFLDAGFAARAYEDTALPIGNKQTISQPFIVAKMTELAICGQRVKKILEVGTGSGYQTAVLSQLAGWVFSVERIRALHLGAKELLSELNYRNISYMHSDGFLGWQSNAPYDAILITAAPTSVPHELLAQLKIGGRMVVPIGDDEFQRLQIFTRTPNGYEEFTDVAVKFVPMMSGLEK